MKIYVVRHGQDFDNVNKILNGHRDEGLTELGKEQANIVADKLQASGIDIIYSSPLIRTYQTARIIANKLGKPEVITNKIFIERDFGILTGKPIKDIPIYSTNLLETEQVTYFLTSEGAEEFPDLLQRAKNALQMLHDKYTNETILIVTHGDFGKMLYAAHNDLSWEYVLKAFHLDNTGILTLE